MDFYQKFLQFAYDISVLIESFSKGNGYIIEQLQRAVLSVSLNIAEGNGRYHRKEKCNFFWIARGSVLECVPILNLCFRKGLIEQGKHEALRQELENITKMLSGLIESNR